MVANPPRPIVHQQHQTKDKALKMKDDQVQLKYLQIQMALKMKYVQIQMALKIKYVQVQMKYVQIPIAFHFQTF